MSRVEAFPSLFCIVKFSAPLSCSAGELLLSDLFSYLQGFNLFVL
jgi:hypothetical protein